LNHSPSFVLRYISITGLLDGIHRVRFNKPLHYPDVIGGHFMISNTELLLKSYDSEFLQLILGSNEERKKEVKDENVWNEVEKIKKKVETLEKDWLS